MPPRIRTRATKALKENIDTENRKLRGIKKTKTVRKALADKTNSLSDDNESIEVPVKVPKKVNIIPEKNVAKLDTEVENSRPRRHRRLPNRYVENHVLTNLSNSKNNTDIQIPITPKKLKVKVLQHVKKTSKQTDKVAPLATKPKEINHILSSKDSDVQIKHTEKKPCEAPKKLELLISKQDPNEILSNKTLSPFKTPLNNVDYSLIVNRPRRICRLPSRFEDHSISPNKCIPLQPCHTSTPIVPNKSKTASDSVQIKLKNNNTRKNPKFHEKSPKKTLEIATDINSAKKVEESSKSTKTVNERKLEEYVSEKVSPDTNNNPKQTRSVRNRKLITKKTSPDINSNAIKKTGRRLLDKSNSLRILEDKEEQKNIDIYEFTFDPNEEPTPKKKKRKRIVKKKPPQPKKQFVYKSNYDKNVSNTLAALKTVVSRKPIESEAPEVLNKPTQTDDVQKKLQSAQNSMNHVAISTNKLDNIQENKHITEPSKPSSSGAVNSSVLTQNYSPVYEDNIDFDHTNIVVNYSSKNAAGNDKTSDNAIQSETQEQLHKDPLNLQNDLSFFDDPPVASSSVNVSTRHPLASPWRVEFESLPIKWHVNCYVKPDMTPAVECSFISSEDNVNKKHVYTNMVPLNNVSLPEIVDNESKLKQTSIISFIKEVAEKQARKKLHKSAKKVNSLFEDITNTTNYDMYNPKKRVKNASENRNSKSKNTSNSSTNLSNDKENSRENCKRKSHDEINAVPAKSPRRQKDKDCTYFGFDVTEDQNENISPVKNTKNIRILRAQSRAALKEINRQDGPTRAVLPLAAKSSVLLGSEAVNKVYEDLKSAAEAPFPIEQKVTNIEQPQVVVNDSDESQSVHLFEDIDIVHHLKPIRKSYGKAKHVTFRQRSLSDSDTQSDNAAKVVEESSDEDDLADLTFHIPEVQKKKPTKKKPTKKKLMSTKEKKEAEAWAAGFNSMCEDVEEFPLLVE